MTNIRRTRKHLDRVFIAKTPAGFKVQVRLRGAVELSGDVWPDDSPGLKDEEFEAIERAYVARFKSWLERANRFYAYGWTNTSTSLGITPAPHVWDHHLQNNGERLVLDVNGVGSMRAANQEIGFHEQGCTVDLLIVESGIWSDELKEENFCMIDDPKILEQVSGDARYRIYDEVTAVVALKRRVEMEKELAQIEREFAEMKARVLAQQGNQKHGETSHMFSIETMLADNTLRITWRRKARQKPSKIIGYCIQGRGFPKARYEQRGESSVFLGYDGQQIVETCEDGSRVLPVVAGSEYGFTFLLQKEGLFSGLKDEDFIHFAVAVPVPKPEQDREQELLRTIAIEKLESELKQLRQPKEERDEADEVVRKLLKEIKTAERAEDTLMTLQHERERSVAEAARNQAKAGGLVGDEAEKFVGEKVARVRDFYDDLRTKYL